MGSEILSNRLGQGLRPWETFNDGREHGCCCRVVGSDSWECSTRSGYSIGVYGFGCVLQCSVQCSKTNSKREKQRMCVKTSEVPTLLCTYSQLQVPLDVRASAAPMTIMTDWTERQTRASSGPVDAARRPQSHAFCTARRQQLCDASYQV